MSEPILEPLKKDEEHPPVIESDEIKKQADEFVIQVEQIVKDESDPTTSAQSVVEQLLAGETFLNLHPKTQARVRELLKEKTGEDGKPLVAETEPAVKTRRSSPEFVRFEYKNGQLLIVEKDKETDKEQKPRSYRKFDLPKEFKEIAGDTKKLDQALDKLGELYLDIDPRKKNVDVKPVPKYWRDEGEIDGFEVVFDRARASIPIPQNDHIMEQVNEIAGKLKEREKAGEKIDTKEEGYWEVPGWDVWKKGIMKRIVEQYTKDRIKKIMADMGVNLDVPEPAQPAEPESVVAPEPPKEAEPDDVLPDPAGVMGDKILTPADVGLEEEKVERFRENVKANLITELAKTLAAKYPKMAARGDDYVRNVAEDAMTEIDLEDAFQKALIAYREWEKSK